MSHALVQDPRDKSYVIVTADDYVEFMNNPKYWTAHIKQFADIDLGGRTITPIGYFSTGIATAFSGIYDGQGFTISNARILWDDVALAHDKYAFGMFGYVNGTAAKCAEVHNLNLSNIHLTRTADGVSRLADNDVKLGILAAAVGPHVRLYDISIDKCRIDDGAIDVKAKALHVGGVVADMTSSYEAYADMPLNANYQFKNVYANVDIDLKHTQRVDDWSDPQFEVGGIVGRIRKPNSLQIVPDNTIYTGALEAKIASISPTVCNMRSGSDNKMAAAVQTYAGEYSGTTTVSGHFADDADYDQFCSTRLYYGYSAYNSNTGETQEVTATYPLPTAAYAFRTRTFRPNSSKPSISKADPKTWAYVQGVNFGKLSDPRNDAEVREKMLGMLNDGVVESSVNDPAQKKYTWLWSNGAFVLEHNWDLAEEVKVAILTSDDEQNYVARVFYKVVDLDYPETPKGTFQWYSTPDINSGEWSLIPNATISTITPDKGLYYKVTWTLGDDVLTSDYRAPMRRIYVYSRDDNQWYNQMVTGPVAYNFPVDSYPADGDDDNDGLTPQTPVRTIAEAYTRLNPYGDVYTNQIVLMGYRHDKSLFTAEKVTEPGPNVVPATITGTDKKGIVNGTMSFDFDQTDKGEVKQADTYLYLYAPLRFDHIDIFARYNKDDLASRGSNMVLIVANYYDLTIDEEVRMINFPNIRANFGLPADILTLPSVTLVAGLQNDHYHINNQIAYPSERYPERNTYYA